MQKPSQRGIVRPRTVVVAAQGRLLPLAGEAAVGGQARPCQSGPRHAVGRVARVAVRDFSPAGVRGQADGALRDSNRRLRPESQGHLLQRATATSQVGAE